MRFHSVVVQAGLKFRILLHHLPKFWDYRHTLHTQCRIKDLSVTPRWQDGSVGKAACCHNQGPALDPQNRHGGKHAPTRHLTPTHVEALTCVGDIQTLNKLVNVIKI